MNEQASPRSFSVADQQHGWIAALPPGLRDYAVLARLDRPIGTWLLQLPCWWGMALGGSLDPVQALLFAIGAIAMRGAGCTINDMADRKFDAMVERTRNRPIAAGRITMPRAAIFLALQMLVGLIVLLLLPGPAIVTALAAVPLIFIYPFMKRITYWPQAFLGITFNWGALVGYAAAQGELGWPALVLYAAGFFWTMGYDTIYAHQDKEDDVLVGVKSTALRLGEATPAWLRGFYVAMLALLLLAGLLEGLGVVYGLALVGVAVLLWRQVRALDIDDGERCLALFRSNRTVGLAVTAAIVIGQLAVRLA